MHMEIFPAIPEYYQGKACRSQVEHNKRDFIMEEINIPLETHR
ncbi:hypothetical protein C900_02684 [Fulvivirga imtechensis AK7]|uniref:Uncharacterized protein n=1 Tax=Fulvivirga imtechensis AK7 TaxID=1237149 RepID=L8K102_9BACT|nr:hypothetical protein C900_02684 [Fulvivirga imtechensis AK7]